VDFLEVLPTTSGVAVVLVDVQRDFLDPTLPPAVGAWQKAFCVPGIQRLLDYARSEGWQIAHVGTEHESVASLPFHHRDRNGGLYCRAGTPGCDFVVRPAAVDTVLFKTWYSAFELRLIDSLHDAGTIVWAGVATDCCVQQSAFDADRHGLRSVIPIQAVSASSCEAFSASLTALGKSAAAIVDIDDILSGKDILDIAIETGEIGTRAERWFEDQVNRLGDPSGLNLDDVLLRLGAASSS
jgi:nicotinamidase-related amidase